MFIPVYSDETILFSFSSLALLISPQHYLFPWRLSCCKVQDMFSFLFILFIQAKYVFFSFPRKNYNWLSSPLWFSLAYLIILFLEIESPHPLDESIVSSSVFISEEIIFLNRKKKKQRKLMTSSCYDLLWTVRIHRTVLVTHSHPISRIISLVPVYSRSMLWGLWSSSVKPPDRLVKTIICSCYF